MALLHHIVLILAVLALTVNEIRAQDSTTPSDDTTEEVTDFTTGAEDTTDEETTDAESTTMEMAMETTIDPDSPADIKVKSFTITSSVEEFDLNVDNIYTVSIEIRNLGGEDVAANSDGDNWAITFYVSDSSNPTSNSATVISSAADASSATNMAVALGSGDSVTLTSVNAMINVPRDDCDTYEYICVRLTEGSTADYEDGDTTNNVHCVTISSELSVYNLECAGCLTKASCFLLLIMALVIHLLV